MIKNILIFHFLFLFYSLLFAQSEFIINTYQDSTQREPVIARDATGNYVVIWSSVLQEGPDKERDLYLQYFNALDQKIGTETRINTIPDGNQEKPAVSMLAKGDFVVVWAAQLDSAHQYDIYGQIFKNNQSYGSNFLVNTTRTHTQTRPQVAIQSDGSFVVVWDSWNQDGSDRGVYGQRFDANGNPVGAEFLVNTTTAYSQARPAVTFIQNGEFVVIWESWNQDVATPSGYGIFGQRFDANAAKIGNEFQINTYTNDYQWLGDILSLADGKFVVAWCSWEQDGDDGGIYLQRYDEQANKVGPELRVNSSTAYYQWLAKLCRVGQENFAVVWSSWKQDGHREGVYVKIFQADGRALTFEERVNITTQNFQWEPGVIGGSNNLEVLAVWSGWGQVNNDYEIVGRRMTLDRPVGQMHPNSITPINGRSSSSLTVHVLDSTALTGDTYQVTFFIPDSHVTTTSTMDIINLTTAQTMVSNFVFYGGEGLFYLTPTFEGIAVQMEPIFELNINSSGSYFINQTGSNLTFDISAVNDNFKNIAPIDVALIWGSTDTLANGQYANPLDTAMSNRGIFEVAVPFRAWNLTENLPVDLWISEPSGYLNQKWDPFETIRLLTPEPYKGGLGDTHAQIVPNLPAGTLQLPGIGDSIVVLANKPLGNDDTLQFVTDPNNFVNPVIKNRFNQPEKFTLENNYPNPFNPTTTIAFHIPRNGKIRLDVFNVLGQRVVTLWDGEIARGTHKVLFDAVSLASGIYFYTLSQDNRFITRKMILLK
ncbi:MAG: T9SS type A sorting domain-containing protein [bacterium]|nr:MAG: T9SS type A sorting domain-containing protein [bacterium]